MLAPGAAGATVAPGPTASLGLGGLGDPIQAAQLRVLRSIDRKLDGGGGYPVDLPIDGGDAGPLRV